MKLIYHFINGRLFKNKFLFVLGTTLSRFNETGRQASR